MASWNSVNLKVIYNVLGWIAFVCWSVSFHPQVVLNFRRKCVVGLNFDYALLGFVKQLAYLVYNASLLLSPTVQNQYHNKYGSNQMLPVAPNDLAFSIHAVLLSGFTLFQIGIYDRGGQKLSKTSIFFVSIAMLAAAVCVLIAIPKHSWFWLVSCFNTIQVIMTVTMYFPQALLNFKRKTTSGFSVGNILLDFLGGITNAIQMVMQSIDQNSLENLFGNIGKTLLALVTIFFDIVLLIQHYLLYPSMKIAPPPPNSTVVNVELTKEINQC